MSAITPDRYNDYGKTSYITFLKHFALEMWVLILIIAGGKWSDEHGKTHLTSCSQIYLRFFIAYVRAYNSYILPLFVKNHLLLACRGMSIVFKFI